MSKPKHLNPLDCIIQAEECRRLARNTLAGGHRIMLDHIAETWDRIAADIDRRPS